MKQTRIILITAVAWLAAGPLAAQTSNRDQGRSPALEKEFQDTAVKESRQTMQEHIAVFRVLLNRAVEKNYGFPFQVPGHAHGREAFHQLPLAEGVYLPGHGVVYSLSAPPPARDPLAKGEAAEVKEATPWEQARRELRGEKVTQDVKQRAPREAPLSEALLRLLADNGKHFSQLPADEKITIAVTFRMNLDCAKCHQAAVAGAAQAGSDSTVIWRMRNVDAAASLTYARRVGDPSSTGQQSSGSSAAPYRPDPEIKNQILMGDLHVRQGRYDEAVRVFRDALKKQIDALAPSDRRTEADVNRLLGACEINNRLAQTLLAAGQREEARSVMTSGAKLSEAAVKLADGLKGAPGRAGISLPAQLIVSAPKKLLEQAGSGKMSFEEFRKGATVEYLRFSAAKEGKKDGSKE